jgi:hypothetical protein
MSRLIGPQTPAAGSWATFVVRYPESAMKTAIPKGNAIGVSGVVALVTSWAAISVGPSIVPASWVPRMWLAIITVVLPGAVVAAFLAARMASKWWYVLAGAGLLSAAFLLAAIGV